MCGGMDRRGGMPEKATYDGTYSAPDLKTLYAQFKEKGTVPYSYYGAGAPTNAEELARVQAAYPGAFKPAQPPAQPEGPQGSGLSRLFEVLRGGFGRR